MASNVDAESARILDFVAHEKIGPKDTKRLELEPPLDGSCALREYQIQNSVDDGFIRLYTSLGHRYWVAQAQCHHRSPDWKVHVSVELDDIPQAWNLVAALFLIRRCTSAMKVVNLVTPPPDFMRGREITLYIFRHDPWYGAAKFFDPVESAGGKTLGVQFEQGAAYWLDFVAEIERTLEVAGVRPRGLAEGDARISSCRFCSLRNEAFVRVSARIARSLVPEEAAFQQRFARQGWSYPPNLMDFNAAGHSNPLFPEESDGSIRRRVAPWLMMVVFGFAVAVRLGRAS